MPEAKPNSTSGKFLQPEEQVVLLLVEDDSEDAFLVRTLVSRIVNFRPALHVVTSIPDARLFLQKESCDVLLLDQNLGSETGTAFIRELRGSGDLRPCILLTGHAGRELDLEAVDAGASDFLQKDRLDSAMLERAVRYNLVQYRSTLQLLQERERHRMYYENAVEGIFQARLRGQLEDANPALATMLGFDSPELLVEAFAHDQVGSLLRSVDRFHILRQLLRVGRVVGKECRLVRPDGHPFWVSLNCRLQSTGDHRRIEGSLTDIADRKEMEDKLLHAAYHDELTGLPNRNLLLERVSTCLRSLSRRASSSCALLLLDLDDFGRVNESLGHAAGDRLVQLVANRLRRILRGEDTVSRLGGDEFGILLPYVEGREVAAQVAQKIQETLAPAFRLQGKEVLASSSIGIAIGGEGASSESMLRDADSALQYAKEQGKKRTEFFTGFLHERARTRLDLEAELASGLRAGQFQAWYQPIIDTQTGRILGAEALVRWRHPVRGLVSPLDFIPLAESSGLISPLGRFMLETACQQAVEWHQEGFPDLYVSVNVSAKQFLTGDLQATVDNALQNSGLDGAHLTLEVTESVAMERVDQAGPQLVQLADMGIRIAIDDFGTGYSSLAYLRRFPFGALKVDRSFIRNLPADHDDAEVVRAIVAMAKALGLRLIAEGIETPEQLHFLGHEVPCDSFQGYLASKPLPPEEFKAFLKKWNGVWKP